MNHLELESEHTTPTRGRNRACLFLFIGNEDNKKIGSLSFCYSITAQLLAKQVYILLTTNKYPENNHENSTEHYHTEGNHPN